MHVRDDHQLLVASGSASVLICGPKPVTQQVGYRDLALPPWGLSPTDCLERTCRAGKTFSSLPHGLRAPFSCTLPVTAQLLGTCFSGPAPRPHWACSLVFELSLFANPPDDCQVDQSCQRTGLVLHLLSFHFLLFPF